MENSCKVLKFHARGSNPCVLEGSAYNLRKVLLAGASASKLPQLEDALAAIELKLTPEETARLQEPYVPHRILGHS